MLGLTHQPKQWRPSISSVGICLPTPPCSPDSATSDFYLLGPLKKTTYTSNRGDKKSLRAIVLRVNLMNSTKNTYKNSYICSRNVWQCREVTSKIVRNKLLSPLEEFLISDRGKLFFHDLISQTNNHSLPIPC